jgi:hypothetical protein
MSFYTSNLEANTAMILDLSEFLEKVIDAVNCESTHSDAAKMVSILASNDFIRLIARLADPKRPKIASKALLALGNLMNSDNDTARRLAITSACKNIQAICDCFKYMASRNGAAYGAYCLAKHFAKSSDNEEQRSIVVNAVMEALTNTLSVKTSDMALKDMLRSVDMLSESQRVSTNLLLHILDTNKNSSVRCAALDLLLDHSAGNFDQYALRSTNILLKLLPNSCDFDDGGKEMRKILHALSNIVVEAGMADIFLSDSKRVSEVCSCIPDNNALWVIANALSKCNDIAAVPEQSIDSIAAALGSFIPEDDIEYKLKDEIVHKIEALRYPDDTESETSELYAPSSPIAEEHTENNSYYPDDAYSIVSMKLATNGTSRTVFDLISKIADSDTYYVPIPDTIQFTVKELKDLEDRGFIISRGYLTINPILASAIYRC